VLSLPKLEVNASELQMLFAQARARHEKVRRIDQISAGQVLGQIRAAEILYLEAAGVLGRRMCFAQARNHLLSAILLADQALDRVMEVDVLGIATAPSVARVGESKASGSIAVGEVSSRPPATPAFLLALVLPRHNCGAELGDLDEVFHEVIVPRFGARRAAVWYWTQCGRAIWAIVKVRAARFLALTWLVDRVTRVFEFVRLRL
jgi:hypothetical protein